MTRSRYRGLVYQHPAVLSERLYGVAGYQGMKCIPRGARTEVELMVVTVADTQMGTWLMRHAVVTVGGTSQRTFMTRPVIQGLKRFDDLITWRLRFQRVTGPVPDAAQLGSVRIGCAPSVHTRSIQHIVFRARELPCLA